MNTEDKIRDMLKDVQKYEDNNLEMNIRNRLNSVLEVYLKEINYSYTTLLGKVGNKQLIKGIINESKFK